MHLPNFLRGITPWLTSHRTRAWLLPGALATACFAAVLVATFLAERADALRRADDVAATVAGIVERDIARNGELFDLALKTAVDGLQVPGIWDVSEQMRNLVLFGRALGIKHLGFIELLDESGNVIAAPTRPHGSNWAGRDYFAAHRRDASLGLHVSRPFATGQEDFVSIAFSRRIAHPDGSFAGVAVASLRLGYVRDLFSRLALGPHGSVTLLRSDGTVLMRRPFDRNDIGRTLERGSSFLDVVAAGASRQVLADPVDHVRRQFAVRMIGDLPLAVSVGLASEDFVGGGSLCCPPCWSSARCSSW